MKRDEMQDEVLHSKTWRGLDAQFVRFTDFEPHEGVRFDLLKRGGRYILRESYIEGEEATKVHEKELSKSRAEEYLRVMKETEQKGSLEEG